jgi:hypothetical protein
MRAERKERLMKERLERAAGNSGWKQRLETATDDGDC